MKIIRAFVVWLAVVLCLTSCATIVVAPTPTPAPMPPTPDARATEMQIAANTFAGRSAGAPPATATATPPPSSTYTPILRPKPTPSRRPTITPTSLPAEVSLVGLNPDEERMVRDGLALLESCAPPMYNYVRSHVRAVARGTGSVDTNAYVYINDPTVYLPESGSINDPLHYGDSMRTFAAAITLVHEARHLEWGRASTEPDAYLFTLPLFEPCKPNDIGEETTKHSGAEGIGGIVLPEITWVDMPKSYCPYYILRSYTAWRAALPFFKEPPAGAEPPAIPSACF